MTQERNIGDSASASQIIADGSDYLVVGTATFGTNTVGFAALYATNGTLVSTFGSSGVATVALTGGYFDVNSAVIQSGSGDIVLAGYGQSNTAANALFAMARLDGSLGAQDTTFGGGYNDGIVLTSFGDNDGDVANKVVLTNGGSELLLVGGTEQWAGSDALWAVAQYNSDGTLDTGFGSAGKKTISMDTIHYGDMITSAAIGSSGTNEVIYLTGPTNHDDIRVVALNANGSVDTAFGSSGTAKANLSDYGYATAVDVAVDASGKILVTANATLNGDAGVMVARFNTSGFLDTSFGSGGDFVDTDVDSPWVTSMALTSGGNIVVAGQAEGGEFMVNEYSPTETQDFASVSSPFTVVQRFAYTPYGQVTVLNADWSPATVSFGHDANGWVYGPQGGRVDLVSGAVNFQARDMNTGTGTWLEADPAGYVDGADEYCFVADRPNVETDPLGLWGKIARAPQNAWASVCSDSSTDTWQSLADAAHMVPDEVYKWVRTDRAGTGRTTEKTPAVGKTYYVPNTVYLVRGTPGDVDDADLFAFETKELQGIYAADGYHFVEPINWIDAISNADSFGMLFAGHGTLDGTGAIGVGVGVETPAKVSQLMHNFGMHHLGLLVLWGCNTADGMWEWLASASTGMVQLVRGIINDTGKAPAKGGATIWEKYGPTPGQLKNYAGEGKEF